MDNPTKFANLATLFNTRSDFDKVKDEEKSD